MPETSLFLFISALGYPLNLLIIILLWLAARREHPYRRFLHLLALGFTLAFAGNIAWIIHDLTFQTPLPAFSWVDGFYLSRYIVIFLAFVLFAPALPPATRIRRMTAALLLTLVIAGLITLELYQSRASIPPELAWPLMLGYALYPVLDTPLLYAAWNLDAAETEWRMGTSLLLLGMACYAAANWINLAIHLFSAEAVPSLPTFFWITSDLAAGSVAISVLRQKAAARK